MYNGEEVTMPPSSGWREHRSREAWGPDFGHLLGAYKVKDLEGALGLV